MTDRTRILIVEDDPNLGEILQEYLGLKGYEATLCRDGMEGEKMLGTATFDLVLLDVMMPKKDGMTLAREVRKTSEIPIIFLTARNQREDVIEGLTAGADDYIVKPFSMEELLLRIKAILRRSNGQPAASESRVQLGSLEYDPLSRTIQSGDNSWRLTAREGQLLHLLARNMNKTTPRKTALKEIWGDDSYFNARSMDVYINKLRKHLRADENLQIITVHGEGFKLVKLS
jgi:DNA-binding response OmpR family regulator